jgi:hypothetical protein
MVHEKMERRKHLEQERGSNNKIHKVNNNNKEFIIMYSSSNNIIKKAWNMKYA